MKSCDQGSQGNSQTMLSGGETQLPSYIGINIGAVSVKMAVLTGNAVRSRVVNHKGRPMEVLNSLLAGEEFGAEHYVGVSGHIGHISEVAALQRVLKERDDDFDAIASLGGESFLVYILKDKRILTVVSHNKCAAGSGEFFVQQIGRMQLDMDEAIRRSYTGHLVPLASRCSVHCKSDITHKLNRREATVEDILYTVHDSMADKVVSLLEKAQHELKRVLLIGGVARNEAMVAALRRKLPSTEIVVLPESSYFEALGTALLTRDAPRYHSAELSVKPTLGRLPPLSDYGEYVRVIPCEPGPKNFDGPLVLGVDAGSTTTKAVLLDPATRRVVASHYGRTHGDPIQATQECLHALAEEVGNQKVGLVATTGSAREIVGAYLGTKNVYNEISSQAAGAAHFDPEVDTIFEIGGQDSKYIYLHGGVPIDYAMNAACSAGTGSFLEESARSDLGMPVDQIALRALAARSPVQFKATCAAFINSDIRIALQEGCGLDDIAAGLVYAVANNYLTKVKGPRFVGKKVFLQGGVALNRAVAYAFAHSVGRQVIVPPSPELLGAQGVGLLALDRSKGLLEASVPLLSLAEPAMNLLGRFTCKACKLYCTIDRFQVAGRTFPFGGRCSLYEHLWKRKSRSAVTADLVAERSDLLFGQAGRESGNRPMRVGIPRALTTHSLYPLYDTFFSELGLEVVLSDIDPGGELKANSGFCFPAQIAHGAVMDLAQKGVSLVFVPHVVRMPNASRGKDCYLCPITQAGPYILRTAFPATRFLSPVLDFSHGYSSSSAMSDVVIRELGVRQDVAKKAYEAAVTAQIKMEQSLQELGRRAIDEMKASGKPTVILVGRSYNAFTPEASQSVGKKLSSMGIPVIPGDCVPPAAGGLTSWHFPNQILNVVKLVQENPNLFLLYISNFSCTIDAFTHSMLSADLGSKPYLMLEIDSHTADAGIQTRLEAFLDIIENYRESERNLPSSVVPCQLGSDGFLNTSSGDRVALGDPRVKIYFPSFSEYHSEAWGMAAGWSGLNPGGVITLNRGQLERGLSYTSGRECLPLPICLGQLLEVHEGRQPGEIAGFSLLRGGAPCVVDSFVDYFERFIARQQLKDLFIFAPHEENNYYGMSLEKSAQHFWPALIVADILVEIEQTLQVVGEPGSVKELRQLWRNFASSVRSREDFDRSLPALIERLAAIPRLKDPADCSRVVVTGDFFTRFSPFFMEGVPEIYAKHGIILKPADLTEMVLYGVYDGMATTAQGWGLEPGYAALAKGCMKVFQPEGKDYLQRWKGYQLMKWEEERYRREFSKTGLLTCGPSDFSLLFRGASKHVSPAIFGETIPSVGIGVEADREGYDGIILIGPFNCLAFRISEAILKPLSYKSGMPIITYESDGYAVSPAFLRQVDVHIQQVLEKRKVASSERPRAASPTGLVEQLAAQFGAR